MHCTFTSRHLGEASRDPVNTTNQVVRSHYRYPHQTYALILAHSQSAAVCLIVSIADYGNIRLQAVHASNAPTYLLSPEWLHAAICSGGRHRGVLRRSRRGACRPAAAAAAAGDPPVAPWGGSPGSGGSPAPARGPARPPPRLSCLGAQKPSLGFRHLRDKFF